MEERGINTAYKEEEENKTHFYRPADVKIKKNKPPLKTAGNVLLFYILLLMLKLDIQKHIQTKVTETFTNFYRSVPFANTSLYFFLCLILSFVSLRAAANVTFPNIYLPFTFSLPVTRT